MSPTTLRRDAARLHGLTANQDCRADAVQRDRDAFALDWVRRARADHGGARCLGLPCWRPSSWSWQVRLFSRRRGAIGRRARGETGALAREIPTAGMDAVSLVRRRVHGGALRRLARDRYRRRRVALLLRPRVSDRARHPAGAAGCVRAASRVRRRHGERLPPSLPRPDTNAPNAEAIRRTRESFGYQWTVFSEMVIDFRANSCSTSRRSMRSSFPASAASISAAASAVTSTTPRCSAPRWSASTSATRSSRPASTRKGWTERAPRPGRRLPSAVRPGVFDFAYSIGVLHHLPEPEKAYQLVVRARETGRLGLHLGVQQQPAVRERRARNGARGHHPIAEADAAGRSRWSRRRSTTPGSSCRIGSRRGCRSWARWLRRFGLPRLKLYGEYPFQVAYADWFDRLAAPIRFYYDRRRDAGLARPRAPRSHGHLADRPVRLARVRRAPVSRLRALALSPVPYEGAGCRFRVAQYIPVSRVAGHRRHDRAVLLARIFRARLPARPLPAEGRALLRQTAARLGYGRAPRPPRPRADLSRGVSDRSAAHRSGPVRVAGAAGLRLR